MTADMGKRLQDVRKRRGLTQRELASVSGVSVSLIRKLEQGERSDTRLETARRLAVALRVPTTSLVSVPQAGAGEDAEPDRDDQWTPVRQALLGPVGSVDASEAPTVAGVRDVIDAALPLFSGDRFRELSLILPAMIRDADLIAETGGPPGRDVRVRLMQLTGWLLTQTRQFEAADTALDRSLEGASDHLQGAATVNTRCWLLLRQGRLGEARELAVRWADDVEPRISRATPAELSAWGWLLLRASAAAVRDNRSGEAEDTLRYANSAAVAMGREFVPGYGFLKEFGPVTVALKQAENAMFIERKADITTSGDERTAALWNGLSPGQLQGIAEWDRRRLEFELSRNPRLRGKIHEPIQSVRNILAGWERLVRRMAANWGPSGSYSMSAYPNNLEERDLLECALSELPESAELAVRPLLEELDDIFSAHTVPDPEGELRHWLRPPDEEQAGEWWQRKPRVQPW